MARSSFRRHAVWVSAPVCAVVVFLLASASFAQDGNEDNWRPAARQAGLGEEDITRLAANGILVTNQSYKQVFEPYVHRTLPVFVTSDSLLNAYHVLYEESIRRMEEANARRLPDILRFILANLDGASGLSTVSPELVAAAKQRAMIVVGTALKLLDDEFHVSPAPLMAIIDDEVAKIVAAEVKMKPAWLGASGYDLMALDYTRYKVRGFYTRNDTLTRYFRAVAWLQSIPFRVSRDGELVAILMLGGCITPERFGGDQAKCDEYRQFFSIYKEFIGVGDDWDLITASDETLQRRGIELDAIREHLLAKAQQEGGPQINDQLRFLPEDPSAVAEPNFRIVSAYRIPGGALFQRTTDVREFRERKVPNGLEICIALGSAFARDRIEDPEKPKLLETIDKLKTLFTGSSLYFDYLNAVSVLLNPPEPNAPAFMEGDAWRAKSCATVLGGWAQLRHSWVLQAKPPVYIAGLDRSRPTAFVEVEPEFFSRMAQLAARTRQVLESAGAFGPDYMHTIEALKQIISLLEESESDEDFWERWKQVARTTGVSLSLAHLADAMDVPFETKADEIRKIIADLERGVVDPSVKAALAQSQVDIASLWGTFEQTSQRLASIARKTLLGLDPNDGDRQYLGKSYGHVIAEIILLGGNAYSTTPDNAPRIVDVYTSVDWPIRTRYLHAGISRARALYVLYPWHGVDILCQGAVLPYYEFLDPGRLTDAEWMDRLDGPNRPDVPSWLRPIIAEGGLSAPEFQRLAPYGVSAR